MTKLQVVSQDVEDKSVHEVRFTEVHDLPLFSRIYQNLKSNRNTSWIASLLRSELFWNLLKIATLILYFGVGIAYYTRKQGWGVGSTIFFTIATMTTVGYGYHHPDDDEGRLFTIFYILVGVYFIFLFVADYVIQMMNVVTHFLKSHFGKVDIATEYKYLNRLIYLNVAAIIATLLIGAACLTGLEGWSFIKALYFAVETSTTVGYGDISIDHKDRTYPFVACYMIFSTILVAFAIHNLNEAKTKKDQILKVSEMLLRNKDISFLNELDAEGDGISESDFVLSILVKLGVVEEEQDLAQWRAKFRALSGNKPRLTAKELASFKGTDALDSSAQIKELMIRSGLSIDLMETASTATRPTYRNLLPETAPRSTSLDGGIQLKKASEAGREDDRAGLMRHSNL